MLNSKGDANMGNLIPFDSEKFKSGQKALTRDGRVATFIGICEKCENFHRLLVLIEGDDQVTSYSLNGEMHNCIGTYSVSRYDLVSMVSRHQHLIDSYDPEDTWQFTGKDFTNWVTIENSSPIWDEENEYHLHPHNTLIKAFKKGKEIIATNTDGNIIPLEDLEDLLNPHKDWDDLRIRPEPEFEYPIYKKANDDSGLIVKFLSLTQGEVVECGNTYYTVGQINNDWYVHTKDSLWQDWTPPTETTEVEPEHIYPIYKKATSDSMVVKFTSIDQGEVVVKGSWPVGASVLRKNHTDKQAWEDWIPPKGWVDPEEITPTTKTVYKWIHEANVGNVNYFVSSWVADEDVEYFFGLDAPKQKYKTGRSWEVEV